MTDNQFTDRYKKLSNADLLLIIDRAADYQPLAVQTAKAEIDSRQLSDSDISNARAEILIRQQDSNKQTEKLSEIKNKVMETGNVLIDTINPIQQQNRTADKSIVAISILLGGLCIYQIMSQFDMITFMFTNSDATWDLSMVFYFAPIPFIAISAFMFFRRKKIGWTLVATYLSYIILNIIILTIVQLNTRPSNIPALDSLSPTIAFNTLIWETIFHGGLLAFIYKQDIRDIYSVPKKHLLTVIGIAFTLVILQSLTLL